MPLDTPLPDRFQEQLEQAVRDVLGGISQAESEVCRELPPPRQPDDLDLACAPELDALTVTSARDGRSLDASLYFAGTPDGAVPVVPDDADDPVYGTPARAAGRSPTYLGDLGGGYADLSAALVETLAAYCGAPEYDPGRAFVGDEADLLCTGCDGGLVSFSASLAYPAYVEQVYADGRRDRAEQYGLPF